MPKQFVLNSICITLVGAVLGYGVTHIAMGNGPTHSLDMASIAVKDGGQRLTKLASQQIYQDYFDVRIKHDSISQTEDGLSVVKAIVTAKKDLPSGISYAWKLGEGVTSNSPEIIGQLGAISRGQSQELVLPVYGFTKHSKKFLSFMVNGNVDRHELRKESLSSSRPEDSFEYVVQQAHQLEEKRAQDDLKENNGKVKTKSVRSKKFDPENIIK
ncbi:MAG: hypothetical protein H7Z71_09640 [Moraxellaceae bacterium]|nr:hypothetical protein [Pseudobdellovibrionaceae bacterium]